MGNNFTNFIETNLKGRITELLFLKSVVNSYRGTPDEVHVVRSGIVMIYAHWEGFSKDAAKSYIKGIRNLNLNLNSLSAGFIELLFMADAKHSITHTKDLAYQVLILIKSFLLKKLFVEHLTSKSIIFEPMLDGNLKYTSFKGKYIQDLCIKPSDFESRFHENIMSLSISGNFFEKGTLKKHFKLENNNLEEVDFINYDELFSRTVEILVHFRNNIAHGKTDFSMSAEQMDFITEVVRGLLIAYKEVLTDYFENKKYLK